MESHVDKEMRRTFACSKCDFVTVSKDSLRGHNVHHLTSEEQVFECSVCSDKFKTYIQLYRHRQKMHQSVDKVDKYVCNFCGKSMKGAGILKNHFALHHSNEKPSINCPIENCVKVFITTKQLQNHMKSHDKDSKEICSECGLVLANKNNLEKHIDRVHLKLRNFGCDLCDYKSCFKFEIAEHVRIYTQAVIKDLTSNLYSR